MRGPKKEETFQANFKEKLSSLLGINYNPSTFVIRKRE